MTNNTKIGNHQQLVMQLYATKINNKLQSGIELVLHVGSCWFRSVPASEHTSWDTTTQPLGLARMLVLVRVLVARSCGKQPNLLIVID